VNNVNDLFFGDANAIRQITGNKHAISTAYIKFHFGF
jgi:hypothetical protein